MSYWRERAAEAIASVIASASVDLKNLSLADKRKLKGAIDASYPFGVRKNHPYQVWLDERRKTFYELGLARQSEGNRKPPIRCDSTVPGQQSLF
ncbi:hypothetical protein [Nostoc sp. TCL240-02]|uniref:hypothetical protein n=1 Tax=Nostoc sp. TCL240-02 TaxID=2572090 RepID=UPI00157F931A|nr:hypothetical protein [Nostoc sp. TCL240-02]QKQ75572.1 hypothetical protein FBB35_21815 [Nostoc sp. TCL240-02]